MAFLSTVDPAKLVECITSLYKAFLIALCAALNNNAAKFGLGLALGERISTFLLAVSDKVLLKVEEVGVEVTSSSAEVAAEGGAPNTTGEDAATQAARLSTQSAGVGADGMVLEEFSMISISVKVEFYVILDVLTCFCYTPVTLTYMENKENEISCEVNEQLLPTQIHDETFSWAIQFRSLSHLDYNLYISPPVPCRP